MVSLCFSKWQGQRDRDRDRETVMFEMCASKGSPYIAAISLIYHL